MEKRVNVSDKPECKVNGKKRGALPSGVEEIVSPEEFKLNPVSVLCRGELLFMFGKVL